MFPLPSTNLLCSTRLQKSIAFFRVLFLRRVDGGEVSAKCHNRERDEKRDRRQFPENQQRKCGADERRGSVIGTGFCRAEVALSVNVKINAQSVSDKAEK